jgi:dimethylargininase
LFQRAIVRKPGADFDQGLTGAGLGRPDLSKAIEQHDRYCEALEACGLSLTVLEEALGFPDSTFVEDTAVLTPHRAILTRPGAPSRLGEVSGIEGSIREFYRDVRLIREPGTLDGGDICDAGKIFFIGISHRTNEEGARQLAVLLDEEGVESRFVDIRSIGGILHLKSGMAYLGEGVLASIEALAAEEAFRGFEILPVPRGEEYCANCVRVNERVLVAAGYPGMSETLTRRGFDRIELDMSEYRKMDGGLSCLSLRF